MREPGARTRVARFRHIASDTPISGPSKAAVVSFVLKRFLPVQMIILEAEQ